MYSPLFRSLGALSLVFAATLACSDPAPDAPTDAPSTELPGDVATGELPGADVVSVELAIEAPTDGAVFSVLVPVPFRVSGLGAATEAAWSSDRDGELATGVGDPTGVYEGELTGLTVGAHVLTLTASTPNATAEAPTVRTLSVSIVISPASPIAVVVTPDAPTVEDALLASAAEPLSNPTWSWTRDGAPATSGSPMVPAGVARRGETWTATVTSGPRSGSASTVVVNALPRAAALALGPEGASPVDLLSCAPIGAVDPDGDPVTWSFQWSVDGSSIDSDDLGADPSSGTFAPNAHPVGATVTCTATPSDGLGVGAPLSASLTLAPIRPRFLSATVASAPGLTCPSFTCVPGEVFPPGHPVVAIDASWQVDGLPWTPGSALDAGADVRCVLRASDGSPKDDGGIYYGVAVTSPPFAYAPTPPTVGAVAILPTSPVVGDLLECRVAGITSACGGASTVALAWTVDGAPAGSGATFPTAGLDAGALVACSAVASEGGLGGPAMTSTAIPLGPAPVGVPVVTVRVTTSGLDCVPANGLPFGLVGAITSRWWVGDEQPVERDGISLEAATFSDCDRVRCQVTYGGKSSNIAESVLDVGADCGDGDPCTREECGVLGGCTAVPRSGPCDDGSACTLSDQCVLGTCQGSAAVCDDGVACTFDSCVPGAGCTHTPATGAACDDADACTQSDRCQDGACRGGNVCGCDDPADCDDGNPCTQDACNAGQCVYVATSGAPCDDGDGCTSGDACAAGSCMGSAVACTPRWFDGDGDTYGVGASACGCAVAAISGYSATRGGDCNDAAADVFPGSTTVKAGVDTACSGWVVNADGSESPFADSYAPNPLDPCKPIPTPFGVDVAPIQPTSLALADCGAYYRVGGQGTIDLVPVLFDGTMSRTSQRTDLLLSGAPAYSPYRFEEFPPGITALGGQGVYTRTSEGTTAVEFTTSSLVGGNCGTAHEAPGCSDPAALSCAAESDPSCDGVVGGWDDACIALAEACPMTLSNDQTLGSDRAFTLRWADGSWSRVLTGTISASTVTMVIPISTIAGEPLIAFGAKGHIGCQDPDVRACVCERQGGACCSVETWNESCTATAQAACGDTSGSRCRGLFFVGDTALPNVEPLAGVLPTNAFWIRDVMPQLFLRPASTGGTQLVGALAGLARATLCLDPLSDPNGPPCAPDSSLVFEATAYYGGFLSGYVLGRARSGLFPWFDDQAGIAIVAALADMPNADPNSVMDVFGTPENPGDDIHVVSGFQIIGYYQLPWALPDVFSGSGRLLDRVLTRWALKLVPDFRVTIEGQLPIEVDFLPRNLVPGISRLMWNSVIVTGELKAGIKAVAPIIDFLASAGGADHASTLSAIGSDSGQTSACALTYQLQSQTRLEVVAPSCKVWNRGYGATEYGHYCKSDLPTTPVWVFDATQNKCVYGIPEASEPILPWTGDPLCNGDDCGQCPLGTDIGCGAPWALRCDDGTCVCRNDPMDDTYPSEEACVAACPAHPPLFGNTIYRLAVTGEGELTAGGDVFLNGHWIEPFGIPDVAFENPAINLEMNFTTYVPTLGFNGDVYYRPSDVGGGPSCSWPVDDPACSLPFSTPSCNPAAPACPSAHECVCKGDPPCLVGTCIPVQCIGESWSGDNCLVHIGATAFFSPPISLAFRIDMDNLSIGNLVRLAGSVAKGIADLIRVDFNPDLLASAEDDGDDFEDALKQLAVDAGKAELSDYIDELAFDTTGEWLWNLLDSSQFEHVELYASTLMGRRWGVDFAPGIRGRVDYRFTDPFSPDGGTYDYELDLSFQLWGPNKGLRLTAFADAPPPWVQALSPIAFTGDPFDRAAKLPVAGPGVTSTARLQVNAPNYGFPLTGPTGDATLEMRFETHPLGTLGDYIQIAAVSEPLEFVNVYLIPEPDSDAAFIQLNAQRTAVTCAPGSACDGFDEAMVYRTVDPVIVSETRHALAITFTGGRPRFFVDGVQRDATLIAGVDRPIITAASSVGFGNALRWVDDVRWWQRVRTPVEIAYEAHGLPAGAAGDPTLTAAYEFDWDDTDVTDPGTGNVIMHNSRLPLSQPLHGFYRNGSQPIDVTDTPNEYRVAVGTSDAPNGWEVQSGAAIKDVGFRFRTRLQDMPEGLVWDLGFYSRPFDVWSTPAAGRLHITGSGPNSVLGDFDDGAYRGISATSFLESVRVEYTRPGEADPSFVANWSAGFLCADATLACDPTERTFRIRGTVEDLQIPLGDSVTLRLDGLMDIRETAPASPESFAVLLDGTVTVGSGKGDDFKASFTLASSTIAISRDGITLKSALDLTAFPKLQGLGLGQPTFEFDASFEPFRFCGRYDDGSATLGGELVPCSIEVCWDDGWEASFDCLGRCNDDEQCQPGQICDETLGGFCVGLLPDGAPCLSNDVCASAHDGLGGGCGSIFPNTGKLCATDPSSPGEACLGFCWSKSTAALGEACVDTGQCIAGTCSKAAITVGLVSLCMCDPDDPKDCASSHFCSKVLGTCRPKRPSGINPIENVCTSDVECQSGRCVAGLCACRPEQCPSGTFCASIDVTAKVKNTCVARLGVGGSCSQDSVCASGRCLGLVCTQCGPSFGCASDEYCGDAGLCLKRHANGFFCTADERCLSNRCLKPPDAGAAALKRCAECTTSPNCASGEYCDPKTLACEPKNKGSRVCACPVGVSCNPNEQCLSNVCSKGFCLCVKDSHCEQAGHCGSGGACLPDKLALSPCTRDAECRSNLCDLEGDSGKCRACTGDADCPPDRFCGGVGDATACLLDFLPYTPCSKNAQCEKGCGYVQAPVLGKILPEYKGCLPD